MHKLRNEIAHYFPGGLKPGAGSLVISDGFDELEKQGAITFYAGKSWDDALAHLRGLKHEPVFGGAYYLEEWSVLSVSALSYYMRAHLEFLLDQLDSKNPDELFVHSFIGALYQIAYMHKGSPFSQEQTIFLRKLAEAVAQDARDLERYGGLGIDIEHGVGQFLAALG